MRNARFALKILTTLTYYSPHISGLTIYARRVIAGLVQRGHEVTVITSHHKRDLALDEEIDGARVVRVPVWLQVSKGVLMPRFYSEALREVANHDLAFLHLPQVEAFGPAVAACVTHKPVITVYHCDIDLPRGIARTLLFNFIRGSHWLTARCSTRIIVNSEDYVGGTPFLRRFPGKVVSSPPPCVLPPAGPDGIQLPTRGPIIGFVGRFAEEKGIEYLLRAAEIVRETSPDAVFAFVGQREGVFGERVYSRLQPMIDALGDTVQMLGILPDDQLANFYRRCSVLALPSINSTESFGMVQVEAMLAGTPVVATDLPGIRQPVLQTGMGEIVPPRDPLALAAAIKKIIFDPKPYRRPSSKIVKMFGVERSIDFFEHTFADAVAASGRAATKANVETTA